MCQTLGPSKRQTIKPFKRSSKRGILKEHSAGGDFICLESERGIPLLGCRRQWLDHKLWFGTERSVNDRKFLKNKSSFIHSNPGNIKIPSNQLRYVTQRRFCGKHHPTLTDYNDAHITIDHFSSNWAAKFSNEGEDFLPRAFSWPKERSKCTDVMKSSPTKKNRCVRHVWWWPWLLLKASFNCPLQSPSRFFFFTVQNCDLFTLLYFKQNIKGISHNVCNHSQCPFFFTPNTRTHTDKHTSTDTHACAPRGLPDQHTSTHTQTFRRYRLWTPRRTHIPHRSAHSYTDKLTIKTIDTHTHTPLPHSVTVWPNTLQLQLHHTVESTAASERGGKSCDDQ